jgi:hypothetical protein
MSETMPAEPEWAEGELFFLVAAPAAAAMTVDG